jgi:chemotaxis protein MotB
MEIIDKVSVIVKESTRKVLVEGHTDNIPISTYIFPSNWELSTTRAVHVIKYMINQNGIDPIRLSAAGYADQHPISENKSIEGRKNNRRVDMVILRSSADSNK